MPTRTNGQLGFGCHASSPETEVARAYALFVLTPFGDRISAITWFADTGAFPQAGSGLRARLRHHRKSCARSRKDLRASHV
jgi:hypothetical protein